MKQQIMVRVKQSYIAIAVLLFSALVSINSMAQDKKVDVNINTKSDNGNNFFMQPWVWIVAAAVFILLLVAILRGNRARD